MWSCKPLYKTVTCESDHITISPQVVVLSRAFCVRAVNAEVVLKATNVDGVYDCDPRHNVAAQLHQHVSYAQVARDRLSVMDATAITLCAENDIPGEKMVNQSRRLCGC